MEEEMKSTFKMKIAHFTSAIFALLIISASVFLIYSGIMYVSNFLQPKCYCGCPDSGGVAHCGFCGIVNAKIVTPLNCSGTPYYP
jgi:hypothetical protein